MLGQGALEVQSGFWSGTSNLISFFGLYSALCNNQLAMLNKPFDLLRNFLIHSLWFCKNWIPITHCFFRNKIHPIIHDCLPLQDWVSYLTGILMRFSFDNGNQPRGSWLHKPPNLQPNIHDDHEGLVFDYIGDNVAGVCKVSTADKQSLYIMGLYTWDNIIKMA